MNVTPRIVAHWALLLLVALFSPACWAEVSSEAALSSDRQSSDRQSKQTIGEPGFDESYRFFQLACANCQNGEQNAASRQIRRSIELLKREAKHATKKGKQALDRSILELSNLADAVESGATNSVDELKAAFARSHHALAYHYQQRAADSWLRQRFKAAGQDLKAASYEVEYGISWVGEGVQDKTRDTLVATRKLANGMIHGAKVDAQQMNSRVKILGQQIRSFGRQAISN